MRLNQIIPKPFRVAAQGAGVALHINGALDGIITTPGIAEDATRELRERLSIAVSGVLSSVQDTISEYLRTPWPSEDGCNMAPPRVRVGTDAIYIWYGDSEAAPVLAIPSIPLAEVILNS
jgi:hypothetical protein